MDYGGGQPLKLPDDADGNGISDLYWINDQTHEFAFWAMGVRQQRVGTDQAATTPVVGRIGWKKIGIAPGYQIGAIADFDGNGLADLIWTSAAHDLYLWTKNPPAAAPEYSARYVGTYPTGWKLLGAGDVDGDGRADLIWYNATACQVGYWIMDREKVVRVRAMNVACGYSVEALADINRDGYLDLLWSGAAKDVYIWYGDGFGFSSSYAGSYVNAERIVAVGMFYDKFASYESVPGGSRVRDRFSLLLKETGNRLRYTYWRQSDLETNGARGQFLDGAESGTLHTGALAGSVAYLGGFTTSPEQIYDVSSPLLLGGDVARIGTVDSGEICPLGLNSYFGTLDCNPGIFDLVSYPAGVPLPPGSLPPLGYPSGWKMVGGRTL